MEGMGDFLRLQRSVTATFFIQGQPKSLSTKLGLVSRTVYHEISHVQCGLDCPLKWDRFLKEG